MYVNAELFEQVKGLSEDDVEQDSVSEDGALGAHLSSRAISNATETSLLKKEVTISGVLMHYKYDFYYIF